MRRLLLVLALAVIASPARAQSWTPLSLGSSSTIRAIVEAGGFSDLYLVGDGGLVAHSDGTRTVWTLEDPLTTLDLFSGRRPASSQIWASGEAGVVRLKLGGVWSARDVPNSSERFVLYSRESGCQNALGSAGSLYQTCDFGVTWSPLDSGVSVSLNHGAGFVTSNSWIVGNGGTILRSTDGGQTWNPQSSGTSQDLHYIIEGGSSAIVVGDGGTILRTTDSGTTWTPSPLPITTNLWAINSSGASSSWMLAVGDGGMVLRSTDGGSTWCQLDPGTNTNLYAVEMVTNSEYIVGGENGVFLRTTDGGGTCSTPTDPPSPTPAPTPTPVPVPAFSWWGWVLVALGAAAAARLAGRTSQGRR